MSDQGFAPPPMPGEERSPRARGSAAGTTGGTTTGGVPRRGMRRGPLIAGIVGGLAALGIVGGVIADVMLTRAASSVAPVARGATGEIAGIRAVAGLCLRDPVDAAPTVAAVTAVDCAAPHRAETVAQLTLDGEDWPGDAVATDALDFCEDRVARIVAPAGVEGLEWRVWAPTQETWDAGDRTAVCVVSSPVDLTGSLEAGTAAPA